MTSYIIKSILCSGILLLCYHLFLQKEKMFWFNRFFLLLSIVFSLIVPAITIEVEQHSTPVEIARYIPAVKENSVVANTNQLITKTENYDWFQDSHIYIYCLITSFLFIRLGKNLRTVLLSKQNKEIIRFEDYKLVLLPESVVTFTFLNYIFVSKDAYQNNLIEKEILVHELAHIRQKHSLDIIFTEVVQALCWFNPLIFLYKKSIQLNHEFLADEAVLQTKTNVRNYQLILLDKMLYTKQINLTSSFNFSITKKRLAMMTKASSFSRQVIKQFGIAVIAFGLAFVFSDKVYAQVEKKASQIKSKSTSGKAVTTGKGLSADLLEEFNSIVKNNSHQAKTQSGREFLELKPNTEQKKRLYSLYHEMTPEQQQNTSLDFFEMPLPVKKSPSQEIFNLWKNPAVFGVWLNERKVSNKELDQYKATDIAEYSLSKLYGAAKKGRTYKYQLDLTTNDYFDKNYQKRTQDRIVVVQKVTFTGREGK